MSARKLGDLEIRRVVELIQPLPVDLFFPQIPREAWEPHLQWMSPGALDIDTWSLLMPMQSYIVRTPHHTVLVDTCIGNHKDLPRFPDWHGKDTDAYMKGLAAHGLGVEDIDYVMCSHLHCDHVGWNTRLEDSRWVPTFPNARYIFSEKEFEGQMAGLAGVQRTPFFESVLPVVEAGRADLVRNDFALDDCIWLEPTPGHSPDHVAINLKSGDGHAIVVGDMMHSPIQCLFPEWHSGPDLDKDLAARTRRGFLERYCETDTLICTIHFPLPSAGRIERQGDGFRFAYDGADW